MSLDNSIKVFRAGSQLAMGLAKEKLFGTDTDVVARQYIFDALASLGPGLPAKAAQLMGTQLAASRCDLSTLLIDDAQLRIVLAAEVPALLNSIKSLSPVGIPGSLGQVHKAMLGDGQVVAIKVQYPEIDRKIQQQLSTLLSAAGLAAKLNLSQFDRQGYLHFFGEKLAEEVDYRQEARSQQRFYDRFSGNGVVVAKVCGEFSSTRVFTQSWINHVSFNQADLIAAYPMNLRQQLAQGLVRTFLQQLLLFRELHGDFHFGNIGISEALPNKLVLLDFGSILPLQPVHIATLQEVMRSLRRGLDFDALGAFCQLGFDRESLVPMEKDLRALWRIFLHPFCTEADFTPASWNFGEESAALLGRHRMSFRMAGPPWFLLLMKAVSGFTACLRVLVPSINTHALVEEFLQGFSVINSNTESAGDLRTIASPDSAAKALCIRVVVNGEERVLLQMPSGAAERLENLVPDDVKDRLILLGYDFNALRTRIVASGFVPQEIFSEKMGEKLMRVWLE